MPKHVVRFFLAAGALSGAGLVSGCGMGPAATATSGTLALSGSVVGGQQGVAGSTIKLYRAGKTGNGSAATSLLTTAVTTDKLGFFSISGDYSCANATDQVYLVALGGNPGVAANNSALAMTAALGSCGTLLAQGNSRFISVNEITTVAAAWALAQFMTGPANLGASATNQAGLQNAFLDSALLADTNTGKVATSAAVTIEAGKVLALADAIATCVNTAGGSGCTPLFAAATPPNGTAPADTLSAALNIVKNPANNVTAIFNLVSATSPFPTTLTSAPNDWTMSATIPLPAPTGVYAYAAPTGVGVDAQGIVWVTGLYGPLNGVTPQGALLSAAGFGVGALRESYGLTIDTSGYIWVPNQESSPHAYGSVSKFQGSNMASPGSVVPGNGGTNFYDNSVSFPYDAAADTSGNVYLANYYSGAATEYSTSTNAPVATLLGYGISPYANAVMPDGSGGVWLTNNSALTITHVLAGGTASNVSCCRGSNGLAVDAAGTVWVTNYLGSSVSAVSFAGATLVNQTAVGGITYPSRLSVDAGGTVWVANYHGSSLSALSSGTVSGEPAIGTALSPSAGLGLDANLLEPYAVIPDASGNLWVSNYGNNDLVMFLGLATPTSTPSKPMPTAP